MIIVEGPDGAGKTTLCHMIVEHFGLGLSADSKLSANERNSESFRSTDANRARVYQALHAGIPNGSKNVFLPLPEVHDRLFFSEIVYGELFKPEGPCFSNKEQRAILRLMLAMDWPVIFCLPPKEEIHKQIYGATHMEGVTENLDRIYNAYSALYAFGKEPHSKTLRGKTGREVPSVPTGQVSPYIYRYDYTDAKSRLKVMRRIQEFLDLRKEKFAWAVQ